MPFIDILVLAALGALAVGMALRAVKRRRAGVSGCGCGCAGCASAQACGAAQEK